MLAPSPSRFGKDLRAYHEHFAAYWDAPENQTRSRKEFHVVQFYQSGFTPQQIREATGYSLAFVHDVARRFAWDCICRFVNQKYIGEPPKQRRRK